MISGTMLRDCIVSGANNITNQKSSVDELNVFPVPDGDTGTNMSMTINAALPELAKLPESCTVETVSQVASSALLRGARGNSGVILSLLFRGFAKALQGKAEASSEDLFRSLSRGVEAAYKAVMKPTEGTMLTVARVSAERAGLVCGQKTPAELWEYVLEVARETLVQTPELLPVLKKAGVVDSGGQGLVYIFEGMLTVLKGGDVIQATEGGSTMAASGRGVFSEDVDPEMTNTYCTEFLVFKNSDANYARLRAYLESIGDSVVAVDDDEIIKCHVHTGTPGRALNEAVNHGYLSKIKIENMLEQYLARQAEGRAAKSEAETGDVESQAEDFEYAEADLGVEYGFVTVSSGDGLKSLFADLGVDRVVNGGQTMNPAAEDILKAIHSVAAKNVIVLANNKNIIMSAEQACKIADRRAVVLPTRNISQGIAAMLAFSPDNALEENIVAMNAAADNVAAGQVTFAARDSNFDGRDIKQGEILALSGGKLLFTETEAGRAAVKLAKRLVKKTTAFVTLIYGAEVSESEAGEVADKIKPFMPPGAEITSVYGGQPIYYYYISAE
jgi:DAK2 domain fusion protein YloV